jgi:hypothetical protein
VDMSELDLIVGTIFVAMGALLFWRAPAQARSHRQELINAGAGDEADKNRRICSGFAESLECVRL